jgi:hypothetical protein
LVNLGLFNDIPAEYEPTIRECAEIKGPYGQKSIKGRLEAFLLDNVGKIATTEQMLEVAKNPITNKYPSRLGARIGDLRMNDGYNILSWKDREDIKYNEYTLVSPRKNPDIQRRVIINSSTWKEVLKEANYCCQWEEGGLICALKDGEIDPVYGGRVKLTPDHKKPHSMCSDIDPNDIDAWQPLCGRHQAVKRNFWDHSTGKMNFHAVVQAASLEDKRMIFELLTEFFNCPN